MKYLLLSLTLLILTLLPLSAAKKIEANPINIAAILVEKTDSVKIASTLEYYGYTPQATENGYCVMKHPNGTEIRFTFNENGSKSKYPTLIVKHNATPKNLSSRLKELNFEKSGKGYERFSNMYSHYSTQCTTGPHSTLIFRRVSR